MSQHPQFAEAFERLRLLRGITAADVARELGVYPGEVSRWRRGGGISIANVRKVADFFGVERAWLEDLAGYPSETAADDRRRDPQWAAFVAELEARWHAVDDNTRNVAERGALALFTVEPINKGLRSGRRDEATNGRSGGRRQHDQHNRPGDETTDQGGLSNGKRLVLQAVLNVGTFFNRLVVPAMQPVAEIAG